MSDTGFEVTTPDTIVEIPPTVETILRIICPNYIEQREIAIKFKITVTVNLEVNNEKPLSFNQIKFLMNGDVEFSSKES